MVVCAALATLALARYGALGWLALPQQLTVRGVAKAVLGVALAYASANALGQLLPTSDALMLREFRGEDSGLYAALFSLAVFTPLLEEWFFRGVLLECMLAVFPARAAVVVTALLFAMLHLTPATIVHHGLMGYVCGRVRLGTRSVWAAVVCHSLYNAVVVLQSW